MTQIEIRPLGRVAKTVDSCMSPLMRLVSGAILETPQSTHRWNNTKIHQDHCTHLCSDWMVKIEGLTSAKQAWFGKLPVFHLPVIGGWKQYVVLQSTNPQLKWYVGWVTEEVCGFSRIPAVGPVRTLIGPSNVQFFGLNAAGYQTPICQIGTGIVGDGGQWCKLPLR